MPGPVRRSFAGRSGTEPVGSGRWDFSGVEGRMNIQKQKCRLRSEGIVLPGTHRLKLFTDIPDGLKIEMLKYTVIIPTLNAANVIGPLIAALRAQTLPPEAILVVDSQSDDDTARRAGQCGGVRVVGIDRSAFDHGGTRDMAIRACDTPFIVLMTQDALPVDENCMAALLMPFEDAGVAAVCARQVAYPEASERERLVRAFRYPDESRTWSAADIPRLGIRAYLLSDVCAAYRRAAYEAVGGFAHPIETNEDMLIAADFLRAGWKLGYRAEARVWHSHDFTLRQEYTRNRKVGAFLTRYADRFPDSGALGEGLRMVKAVSAQLLKRGRIIEWLAFGFNCLSRMLGNRAGRRQEKAHE